MSLWSKTDTNLSKPKFLDRGQIVGFTVNDGGTGYGTGTSTVVISAPNSGTRATATVTAVGGAVTGLTITNPGAGYTSTDTITTTFGDTGQITGFTITDGGSEHVTGTSIATISAPNSGTQATATVVADEDGAITDLVITNPGAGYTGSDTITVAISVAGTGSDITALYSSTGSDADLTALYHGAPYADGHIYFVDNSEAQVAANIARGLNAPGWWLYKTKVVGGVTRPVAHHLVALSATAANAGDASDDSVLADS